MRTHHNRRCKGMLMTYRSTHASARSRLSLNTPVTPLIMSRLSVESVSTRVAAIIAALPLNPWPFLSNPLCCPFTSSNRKAFAHRSGNLNMKVRTAFRACSGRALPAYLDTTSTTCRMVLINSFLTWERMLRDWNGTTALEVELDGRFCGAMEVMKERRRRICWSICALAYWIQNVSTVAWNKKIYTYLKPLQAIFQTLHALLAYRCTNASCFQENGLPPASADNLHFLTCSSLLLCNRVPVRFNRVAGTGGVCDFGRRILIPHTRVSAR